MLFKKEFLKRVACDDTRNNECEIMECEITYDGIGHDRSVIFKVNGLYYKSVYDWRQDYNSCYEDYKPYEHEPDEIECIEVRPVEKKTIVYEEVLDEK